VWGAKKQKNAKKRGLLHLFSGVSNSLYRKDKPYYRGEFFALLPSFGRGGRRRKVKGGERREDGCWGRSARLEAISAGGELNIK
jgi:hypothetical protein